jgi:hypothetical protein
MIYQVEISTDPEFKFYSALERPNYKGDENGRPLYEMIDSESTWSEFDDPDETPITIESVTIYVEDTVPWSAIKQAVDILNG